MNDDREQESADGEFAQVLRRALRASEDLDYVTTQKLRVARARAMEPAGRSWSWLWIPGGLTAVLALVSLLNLPLLSLHGPISPPAPQADVVHAEALDVLADDLDPEFYEDLEMYQWLNHAPASADRDELPGA